LVHIIIWDDTSYSCIILRFLAVIGFTSCSNGTTDEPEPEFIVHTYKSVKNEITYILEIFQPVEESTAARARAADDGGQSPEVNLPTPVTYTPAAGDTYKLTIIYPDGETITSSGTIALSSTTSSTAIFSLSNGVNLKVTITKQGALAVITGTIIPDPVPTGSPIQGEPDKTPQPITAPGAVTPDGNGSPPDVNYASGGTGGGGGGGTTHTHSYSTTWSSNAAQHWRECTANDGAKTDVANHSSNPCTVCGYSSGGGTGGTDGTPAKTLTSISAAYTPTTAIFPDITHDTLKEGLIVTAHYSDGTSVAVTGYTLSGDFTVGESVITVSYTEGGVTKTATFTVTVVTGHSNHIWGAWTPITPATCTTAEVERQECNVGDESHHEDREIPINPAAHEWNTVYSTITAATETTDGTEAITCIHNASHTKDSRFNGEYATGTAGLDFQAIGTTAYRVHNKDTSNGTATGAIFIPAYHRSNATSPYLPVTQIGNGTNTTANNAFGGTGTGANTNTTLTSVTFAPNSQLTAISNYAFYGCSSLTSVTIPAGTIGSGAFQNCANLASVTIGTGVTSIGQYAFFNLTNLASLTFESTIPAGSFQANAFNGAGDIRAKYLVAPPGGGIGTYTRTPPLSSSSVWTKD